MSKGDASIVKVNNEVGNLFINSNMRYSQRATSIVGTTALGPDFTSYTAFDRFLTLAQGANDTLDAISRVSTTFDPRFDFVMDFTKRINLVTDAGVVVQKVESIFSKKLASKGVGSYSFLVNPISNISTIDVVFSNADLKDDFTGTTVFKTITLNVGTDFQTGIWNTLKVENISMPLLVSNGLMVQLIFKNDGITVPQTINFQTVGWMLNAGSKVLPWQLMRGDDVEELRICQRYFEKSYDVDVDPGTITASTGAISWVSGSLSSALGRGMRFKEIKRVAPTGVIYDPLVLNAINASRQEFVNGGTISSVQLSPATGSFSRYGLTAMFGAGVGSAGSGVSFHFIAGAEL